MPKPRSLVALLDAKPLVKSSRLAVGGLSSRGLPAVLLGIAGIVLAAGVGGALKRSATLLPETLREAREFWLVARGARRELTG